MKEYIKLFDAHNGYSSFRTGDGFIRPNVSRCDTEGHVHYNQRPKVRRIDLGLPGNTIWASINVGAGSETECGDYFSWGSTDGTAYLEDGNIPYGKKQYWWTDYELSLDGFSASYPKLTRYCPEGKSSDFYGGSFTGDELEHLDPEDDAAITHFGYSWKMPTKYDFIELMEYTNNGFVHGETFTKFSWDAIHNYATETNVTESGIDKFNGVDGMLFFKLSAQSAEEAIEAGEYMFMPAGGGVGDGSMSGIGLYGFYWTADLSLDNPIYAWCMGFGSGGAGVNYDDFDRCFGYNIRAVEVENK